MLRLARIHPLVRISGLSAGRSHVHISRVFSSTTPEKKKSAEETLNLLINSIKPVNEKSSSPKQDKVPVLTKEKEEEYAKLKEEEEDDAEEEPHTLGEISQRTEERFFPTQGTTAEAYDRLYEKYPALEYKVDTDQLDKRHQFEHVYFANFVHEPKKVIKFKNLVTKNYRTVARSWPMVRLNSFKYGSEHFLDEMYDEIKGKRYHWDNQLAYPDGSINLFCGTSSKASPLNVKGDPLALTFDDNQYKTNKNASVRLTLPKDEAAARFPYVVAETESELLSEEPDAPLAPPPSVRAKPKLDETEAEQDEREAREEREAEEAFLSGRVARKDTKAKERAPRLWREEVPERETKLQREARWEREKEELYSRPWIDLMRQKRAIVDERVLFDPVTMVKIVSHTFKGKIIERYYYKDQLKEDNVQVYHIHYIKARTIDAWNLQPGYNKHTGVIETLPDSDCLAVKESSLPAPEDFDQVDYPNFPSSLERNTHIAIEKLLPLRGENKGEGKGVSISSSTPSSTATVGSGFKTEPLRTDLLDGENLPEIVKQGMIDGFRQLVSEGKLKEQDETKYFNDVLKALSIALARQKTEELRLNKYYSPESDKKAFPGMIEIGPTYYFKYIKLNLAKGWIRFYVGEQDKSLDKDLVVQVEDIFTESASNPMKFPFVWKYNEYKLSKEDLEAMRSVKWPPSLVPPPTSFFQSGDGGPAEQLAKYFENSYLKYGNMVRLRQDLIGDEALENTKIKHLYSVDPDATAYIHVPDPGPIDFSKFTNPEIIPTDPEARAKFDLGLREIIKREAKDSMSQAKKQAYQDVIVRHDAFQTKMDDIKKYTLGTNDYNVQLEHNLQNLDIDTLRPTPTSQVPLAQRFQQRGNTVVAFEASGGRVIQEYLGYRLKVSRNIVRIIRIDQIAAVRFYDPKTGQKVREEDHSGEFFRPRTRIEGEESDTADVDKWEAATDVGDAWAFVETAHDQLVRVYNGESADSIYEEIDEVESEDVSQLLSAMEGFDASKVKEKSVEDAEKELDDIKDELLRDVLKKKE